MPTRSGPSGSGSVVELAFSIDDPTDPFVGASDTASCRIELEEMVPRGGDEYAEFYSLYDATPAAVGPAELGALPRSIVRDHGEGEIVAELPSPYDAADVGSASESEYGGELVAKHEREAATPLFTQREFDRALEQRLTDRQREVLRTAFGAGDYDWPARPAARSWPTGWGSASRRCPST